MTLRNGCNAEELPKGRRTMMQQRGNRIGSAFSIRLTDEQRQALREHQARIGGPRGLGPWLVWAAMQYDSGAIVEHQRVVESITTPKIILDLCAGSGAWSRPYADAGYDVRLVTWPDHDVRMYIPPANVHGVLAAPPCTEFSIAKVGERDFDRALVTVVTCLRIIALCRPVWWAMENPGRSLLARFLGPARDTWEPYEFGDSWSKRTAIWGDFTIPKRGPFVESFGSAVSRSSAAKRAITPPGFARAFCEANP